MVVGYVAKLQRYATKDGPGLRTTVFMSGCNLRCKWCANPEMLNQAGGIFYYKERCQHCGICVNMAANHAIKFAEVGCIIDRNQCDNLPAMIEACPFEAYEHSVKEYTSDELVGKLLRDREFYEESGGGVTFSGGEAALQADFVYECAKKLHKEGIHVTLDTAGCVPLQVLQKLSEVVDLILYDIKAYDALIHQQCTGVDNRLILENAKYLATHHQPMMIRMIVVPQMNDDMDDINARLQFIKELGDAVLQVDILPYHNLGEGKYDKLGLTYELHDTPNVREELLNEILQAGKKLGLQLTIGG